MSEPSENLLLRIRTETLRLNLERAHSNLLELPSISGHVAEIQKRMNEVLEEQRDLRDKLANLRKMVSQKDTREAISDAQSRLDLLGDGLEAASNEVEALKSKSFLVKMGPVAKSIWKSLEKSADGPRRKVAEVESRLSRPEEAWKVLAEAEKEASEFLFKESVELLGGFALRDTRLDKNICELADALIQSIRAAGDDLSVIPGGIGSMMMTIERIIRLPFTEWTVWALPIAAHEYWRVSVREQFNHHLAISLGHDGAKHLDLDTNQRCLGDAFATYVMGPTYAFAAITLLFSPMHAADDLRVLAVVKMLSCMEPTNKDGFTDSLYQTIMDTLLSEWNAAKHQTGVARAQPDTTIVDRVVPTLFKKLKTFGFPRFSPADWNSAQDWAAKLLDGTSDKIDVSREHDLRHVISAAWIARIKDARTDDITEISTRAQNLADRVKDELTKRPSGVTRRVLRGLT
jgi:hypothetical protein